MNDLNSYGFIFDMDGTLVDNMRVHAEAWRLLLEENGLEMDPHNFLVATAGKTNREILPTIFGEATAERLDELALRKEELYRDAYLPIRQPVAGLIDFLTEARDRGIRMAVATAASHRNMEFILDGLELRQYFAAVTTASDVKHGKPDPAMFLVSAEKLGVETRKCLVFEDAFGGFEAAHRAGMKSIGLATVNTVEQILERPSVVEAHADFTSMNAGDLVAKYLRG